MLLSKILDWYCMEAYLQQRTDLTFRLTFTTTHSRNTKSFITTWKEKGREFEENVSIWAAKNGFLQFI